MTEKSGGLLALNLLSFDGGGITGLSSLLILREIMTRLQQKNGLSKTTDPWEHFDLIAGTGTGAICAVMVGRLRMSVGDAIKAYANLASNVFCDKKLIGPGGPGVFSATKLEQELKTIVEKATGDPEERMMQEIPNEIRCKVVVYAMSAHNMNAGLPCAFRTYPVTANAMPDCTIWEALRASTAHPGLFESIEIEEFGIGQHYVGGRLGCSNPTAQMLREAATLFPGRAVASVVSIGTGHARTIQIPQPNRPESLAPVEALKVALDIALDNERVAEEMAARFSDSRGIYYRLNVDQGMQSIDPSEWESQGEIAGHTTAYIQKAETNRLLDTLADSVYERRDVAKIHQIDGRAAISTSSSPIPSNYCPRPTPLFTGRTTEVEMVTGYFGKDEPAQQVFVLYGLGGAGKTQTALKSAELMMSKFEGVIFIDGSSSENIETALSGFAVSGHIGSAYMDALNWLGSRSKRWLIIFDNVDDPNVRLHEYFPRNGRYSILITTRQEDVINLPRDKHARYNISELESEDARRLLLDAAGLVPDGLQDSENAAAVALLRELGNLALAVVQSGAYIRRTKCSIAQYLEMFLTESQDILAGDGVVSIKVDGYERSLNATWELSYRRVGDLSRCLLGLAAFLHRDYISEDIFRRARANIVHYRPAIPPTAAEADAQREVKKILDAFINKSGDWSSRLFLWAMGELVSLSLVTLDKTMFVYHFHPLVQQWVRSLALDMSTAIDRAAFLVAVSIDRERRSEDHAFRRSMAPHVNEILGLRSVPNANNAWQFVLVYEEVGDLNAYERLELLVLKERRRALGNEHPETLEIMRYVAGTHGHRGRHAEAESLKAEVLVARKRVLGDDHPDTLQSMNNLAVTYHAQGRLREAEVLEAEVLAARKRVLGDDHPHTLQSMDNLASTYHAQGRLREAEVLKSEVLAARKRVLGDDHPETLQSIANLAATYSQQGRLTEAEVIGAEVLAARKRMLGDDHPHTLHSMDNLASTYHAQGRLREAESLNAEVLAARKRVLGDDHPDTLQSMNNLAVTYHAQGRLREAEVLKAEVLAARKRVLGDDHPDTLQSMNNLASTYRAQGRLTKAEVLHAEVLAARKRVLGDDHPDTLQSMNNLAMTYHAQGRLREAEVLKAEVLAARKRVLGDDHPETLQSMSNLAVTYHAQGRPTEAEVHHAEVLAARKRVLGDDHPDTLHSMGELAVAYLNQGRLAEAEVSYLEVVAARKRVLGDNHPDTLWSMGLLAETYHNQGRLVKAEALHTEVLAAQKRVLGDNHPNTLKTIRRLATIYYAQGRQAEYQSLMSQVNMANQS